MPWLERIFDWCFRKIFKYNYDTQVITALAIHFLLLLNGALGDACGVGFLRGSSTSFCAFCR